MAGCAIVKSLGRRCIDRNDKVNERKSYGAKKLVKQKELHNYRGEVCFFSELIMVYIKLKIFLFELGDVKCSVLPPLLNAQTKGKT